MVQSLSGGSGNPSRITRTLICALRESSNMRQIIHAPICAFGGIRRFRRCVISYGKSTFVQRLVSLSRRLLLLAFSGDDNDCRKDKTYAEDGFPNALSHAVPHTKIQEPYSTQSSVSSSRQET
jgi:hypothetical protein